MKRIYLQQQSNRPDLWLVHAHAVTGEDAPGIRCRSLAEAKKAALAIIAEHPGSGIAIGLPTYAVGYNDAPTDLFTLFPGAKLYGEGTEEMWFWDPRCRVGAAV